MKGWIAEAAGALGVCGLVLAVGAVAWRWATAIGSCAPQCPDCRGSGKAAGGFPDEDCPTCHGTGEDPDAWMPKDPDRSHDRRSSDDMGAL